MTFVISGGQLASIDRPLPRLPRRLQISASLSQDYATIFRTQPQVRTVVSFLARNIAQLGLPVYRRKSDTDRERLTDHALPKLIERPTPRTTRWRLLNSLVHDLGIYDEAMWIKSKDAGEMLGLIRVPPQMFEPVGDSWIDAEAFKVKGTRGSKIYQPDEVVYFHGHNAEDGRIGLSPIETLRRILAEEFASAEFREQMWRNGARMSGYLKRPAGLDWSDEARERFKAGWQAQYAGQGPEAGGTPILEDGMEFEDASVTPRDAEYLGARKLTREEVAAAYHVSPPMVGILDHATFSNITELHKGLYQDTLGPWLSMIEQEIMLQLIPDLPDNRNVYCEFNLAEKLKGSFEEQAGQLQSAVGAPWMLRSEARARMNLPEIPGADQLVTPLNVLVGGQASPRDSAPKRVGGKVQFKARAPRTYVTKAEQVIGAFFDRQAKVLASKLGASKAAGDTPSVDELWDDDRWNKELSQDLFSLNALVSEAAARRAMEILGLDPDEYDVDRTLAWLLANADGVAEGINGATKAELAAALEAEDPAGAVKDLYAGVIAARVGQIAMTQVTSMSGFGVHEAAQQTERELSKTWVVNSAKPRPSHADMNGETVALGELFSNGARWPGDSQLDDDERAGCTCEVDITAED